MKAAVIYHKGEVPVYAEVPEPVSKNENEAILFMKAAAIKHFDKSRAGGKHYSSENDPQKAVIIGGDGAGLLADGTRVFALGAGMIAEKAIAEKNRMIKIPAGVSDAVAAALPNAVAGSAMALRFRAGMKGGETVLINGATGFTGKIAVQVAKHYGAKRIIATGRNLDTLQSLRLLGADEVVLLSQEDGKIISQIRAMHAAQPIDIVIDYLWGHPAQLILSAFKGNGSFTNKLQYVSVGAMAGDTIELSAEMLRSNDIQLSGSGLGSWSRSEMQLLLTDIVPEMFVLVTEGKLKVDVESVPLADIEKLWAKEVPDGKRLVVMI